MSDATLDAPCPHGHYEPHDAPDPTSSHWERCPGGSRRPVAEIPWCAEHDAEWIEIDMPDGGAQYCWHGYYLSGDPVSGTVSCRLEEPPRHVKIGEAE